MYAVIETGGKQYRVEVGTELEVELLEVSPGDAITLERVLLVADGDMSEIGRPIVQNATVAAEVVRQTRGEKLINFKYRPKARRRVKKGHRQELTVLRISDIRLGSRSAAADAASAVEARLTERQRLEDAAQRQAATDAALAATLAAKAAKVAAETAPPAAAKVKAAKAAKAAPAAKSATTATKSAKSAKAAKAATTATKSTKSAKAATTATKSTKPRAATAASTEAAPPADKPKRTRAVKKDE